TPAKPSTESSADVSSAVPAGTPAATQKAPAVEATPTTTPVEAGPPTSSAENQTTKSQTPEANQTSGESVPPAPSIDETRKQGPAVGFPSVQAPTNNQEAAAPPTRASVPVAHKPI